jgi:hypothetical protein
MMQDVRRRLERARSRVRVGAISRRDGKLAGEGRGLSGAVGRRLTRSVGGGCRFGGRVGEASARCELSDEGRVDEGGVEDGG